MNKLETLEKLNEIRTILADMENDLLWYTALNKLSFERIHKKLENFLPQFEEMES